MDQPETYTNSIWNLKAKISLKSEILWKNLKTHPTSSQTSQAGAR